MDCGPIGRKAVASHVPTAESESEAAVSESYGASVVGACLGGVPPNSGFERNGVRAMWHGRRRAGILAVGPSAARPLTPRVQQRKITSINCVGYSRL